MAQPIKYPHIKVPLIGQDGNAFAILGRMQLYMRRNGVTESEIQAFIAEATEGDYDNLLQTCMRWVEVY